MKGSLIETSMCDYDVYLISRGVDIRYWSLEHIAGALEGSHNQRRVLEILELMTDTDWSEQFDHMYNIIDDEYGPELADLFNVYNIMNLIRSKI
jgi:hypothetical protein